MVYNALFGFLASKDIPEFEITGVQSGTLPLGNYTVTGDIVVREGTTLTLTPGSTFLNADDVLWEIQGTLNAPGTSGAHITFGALNTSWHGIRFCKEAETGATGTATANAGADTISISGFTPTLNFPIYFTTTGTLPAPLQPYARYYNIGSNQYAERIGGSAIDITDTGSGTHTAVQLSPSSSTGLTSSDSDLTQTMSYCDFSDCDKTNLPSQYNSPPAYRHWYRGGGLMTYELEDMNFDHLTFDNCGAIEGGGGAYIQGASGGTVSLTDFTFTDCYSDSFPGASYRQSHGEGSTTLTNFTFNNSIYAPVNGYPFVASASTDRITFANAGITMYDNFSIKDLAATGSLPGGLSGSTVYYFQNVVNESPSAGFSTAQLSLTPDGSVIDLTSDGSGDLTMTALEDYIWFSIAPTISGFSYS